MRTDSESANHPQERPSSPPRPSADERVNSRSGSTLERMGVVVIGRNEGERLAACLRTLVRQPVIIVYVDSGSTDDSVALAHSLGTTVLELDTSVGFTAARARNAGWRLLLKQAPHVEYIQFVDGDCAPDENWLSTARDYLDASPRAAAVCGRTRERLPNVSVYNLLCDIEFDGPPGEVEEFGGGVLVRRQALEQVDGYVDSMIAAEDTEFGARLRKAGWSLTRLPVEMQVHDAHMLKFSQWWKRAVRSGHANAEMHHRHGGAPLHSRSRQTRSSWFWGLILPLVALGLAWPTGGASLSLLGLYPLFYLRILLRARRRYSWRWAHWFASFCILGKFPEVLGQFKYHLNRLRGRQSRLIEYKGPATRVHNPLAK